MSRPFDAETLVRIRRFASFDVSPDGRWLVAAIDELSEDEKRYDTNLYRLDLHETTGELAALTCNTRRKSSPRFCSDGTLAFLAQPDPSRRHPGKADEAADSRARPKEGDDAPMQVHRMDVAGGEPVAVTSFSTGVAAFEYTKDLRRLVTIVPVHPGARDLDDNDRLEKAWRDRKSSGVLHRSYPVRFWDHWHGPRHGHFVVSAADGTSPRDLTPDLGTFALDEAEWDLSPDGRTVVTDIRSVDDALRFERNLFLIDLESGKRRALTTGKPGWSGARFSPDGARIVAVSHHEKPRVTGKPELKVHDLASGEWVTLAKDLDRWPVGPEWVDGGRIAFTADDSGRHAVFVADVRTGAATALTSAGHAANLKPSPDGKVIRFLLDSLAGPADVHAIPSAGGSPQRLTRANDALLEGVALGKFSSHSLEGVEGAPVQLWEILPPGFDPSRKYPLLLWIHGGPLGAFLDQFHFRWNPHLHAAPGFVLILVNPRGSTGFGQPFIEGNNGDWGNRCYQDLMKAVDAWERKPYVDTTRMAACGASFGGYMANWVAGHTGRFKCLVSHAGLYNLQAFHGTTDAGTEWELEFGGAPWDAPDLYERHSPHHHVRDFKTPTLVIHGELDYRVPLGDGLQMFQALQERKVPSELLYFPDENHWILKPANMRLWNDTVAAWLARWLSPKAS